MTAPEFIAKWRQVELSLDRIVARTNFINTTTDTHTIQLEERAEPRSLDVLRAVAAPGRALLTDPDESDDD